MPSLDLLSLEFWAKASDFWAKDSQSLNHLALIIAGVIGIPLLAIRTFAANKSAKAADAQARTAEQGHITDRFTAAVEQLGSDKMAVRLGAVYALERISKDSKRDHWTIMETLTAFVRERAPLLPRQSIGNPFVQLQDSSADQAAKNTPPEKLKEEKLKGQDSVQIRPATDIQAALTVLGRRDRAAREQDQAVRRSLDLANTDLQGAFLGGAHLEGVNLREAHLQGAWLGEAHLERAHLLGAHLERAWLGEAHLEDAHLGGAHLEGAYLLGAHLEGAYLWEAVGLTQRKLEIQEARGDDRTILPKGVNRPAHWSKVRTNRPDKPDNAWWQL